MIHPVVLNDKLSVYSYDGAAFGNRPQYHIKNVLIPTIEPFHCSARGIGFTLILEAESTFTMTHLFISGPGKRCTEPTRSGLVWVTDDPMICEDGQIAEPPLFFLTNTETRRVEIELPHWREGRYLVIKFLDTHNKQENIDIGIVAAAGFWGRHRTAQRPLGPWFMRERKNNWIHPHPLNAMFSSGGWVCDGRDFSGGCRSGMLDFHQTSVYTVTYRCVTCGFDLCEKCAEDHQLGHLTEASVDFDVKSLAEPNISMAQLKLATYRIINQLRRLPHLVSWYLQAGLIPAVCTMMENHLTDERRHTRHPKKVIFDFLHDLSAFLLPQPDVMAGDSVWAKSATKKHDWDEGRVISLDGNHINVCLRDGSTARVPAAHVWKMVADEDIMMTTASLYMEATSASPALDRIQRLLHQGPDMFAVNACGLNILTGAVELGTACAVRMLLENACPDAGSFRGSPLQHAVWRDHYEICEALLNAGADPLVMDLASVRSSAVRSLLLGAIGDRPVDVPGGERCTEFTHLMLQNLFRFNYDEAREALVRITDHGTVDGIRLAIVEAPTDFMKLLEFLYNSDSCTVLAQGVAWVTAILRKKDPQLTKLLVAHGVLRFSQIVINGWNRIPTSLLADASALCKNYDLQEDFRYTTLEELCILLERGDSSGMLLLRDVIRRIQTIDFHSEEMISPYVLQVYEVPAKLNGFLQGAKVIEGNHFIASGSVEERWQSFNEYFVGKDLKALIDVLQSVIMLYEELPLQKVRAERGLKVLMDTIQLKMVQRGSSIHRPKMNNVLRMEPLATMEQIKRYVLSTTPVLDAKYLRSCHDVVGRECQLLDGCVKLITDFRLETELNLPVHTVGSQKMILSVGDVIVSHRIKDDKLHNQMNANLALRVSMCQLQITSSPSQTTEIYSALNDAAASISHHFDESEDMFEAELTGHLKNHATKVLEALGCSVHSRRYKCYKPIKRSMISDLRKLTHNLTQRQLESECSDSGQEEVDPEARVHTVNLHVSEDIPFDMFWPMVRDDIITAVRELPMTARRCWSRGMMQMENAVQAGVVATGSGPIGRGLTLAEASALASRVVNVVQTSIVIDRSAMQDLSSVKEVDAIELASRIQFNSKDDTWLNGVLVNKSRSLSIVDDSGVLWENVASSRVRVPKIKFTRFEPRQEPQQVMIRYSQQDQAENEEDDGNDTDMMDIEEEEEPVLSESEHARTMEQVRMMQELFSPGTDLRPRVSPDPALVGGDKRPSDVLRRTFDAMQRASDASTPVASLDHPIVARFAPTDEMPQSHRKSWSQAMPITMMIAHPGETVFEVFQHSDRLFEEVHEFGYELRVEDAQPRVKRKKVEESWQAIQPCLSLLKIISQKVSGVDSWVNKKLDRKLRSQMEDALSVCAVALPNWAKRISQDFPSLFSLETRKMMLRYTGFGLSFSVHWIQEAQVGDLLRKRQTVQTELNSAEDARRMQELSQELSNIEDHVIRSQFWFGSLKCTLVKLEKDEDLVAVAERILDVMSKKGALANMMEVQFLGETGFGTAVTKNFYCEICKSLQDRKINRSVPMWVEDDDSGPFLLCRTGLMLRPLVQQGPEIDLVKKRFRFLGRLMAMSLREGYLMPLPLTADFFRSLRGEQLSASSLPRPGSGLSGEFLGVCLDHAAEASDPPKKKRRKTGLLNEASSSSSSACFNDYCGEAYFLETGFSGAELIENGENIRVTSSNVDEFIKLATEFWFNHGIQAQVSGFRRGFEDVLPWEGLETFSAEELRDMFCGEETIEWDQDSLLDHVHPVGTLTKDSQEYKFLISTLIEMNNKQRSQFLDFVSSCPRLPPGGIGGYHMDVHLDQGRYPRSRACANQLYVPHCRSQKDMHEKLVEAMTGSAGHHELQINL